MKNNRTDNKSDARHIISSEPQKKPYGSKLTLFLDGKRSFKLKGETCLLVGRDHILKFVPGDEFLVQHEKKNPKFQVWDIYLDGFSSAGEAEKSGLRLAAALLWSAISQKYPVRLLYNTPLPCLVYNRNASKGFGIRASGYVNYEEDVATIVKGIESIYCSNFEVGKKLLLAMELFASAPLEITRNAKFIMLITSIEALAEQAHYGEKVSGVISLCRDKIFEDTNIVQDVRASILDRLQWLDKESIGHSIRGLIRKHLPMDKDAEEIIMKSYDVRSALLHDGETDADIDEYARKIEQIMRKVFASCLGLTL